MSTQPNTKHFPKRYAYGTQAVYGVKRGEFYVFLDRGYALIMLSAEDVHARPTHLVRGLRYPNRHMLTVPMSQLYPIRTFDHVIAQVGYPAIDHTQEGEEFPQDITPDTLPQLVGKFYTYHVSHTTGRTNAVMDTERKIVFLLGLTDQSNKVYICSPLQEDVLMANCTDLRTITNEVTDDNACKRANKIMHADSPPSGDVFSTTPCTNIQQLRAGTYYHCPPDALRGNARIDNRWINRTPVLYLGPAAAEGKAYVFGDDQEAIVDVKYLYPLDAAEMDTDEMEFREGPRGEAFANPRTHE